MRHPIDGTLRRYLDEAYAVPVVVRTHVQSCAACKERLAAMSSDRSLAQAALAPGATNPDTAAAYVRLQRAAAEGVPSGLGYAPRLRLAPIGYVASAAALVAAIAFTPVGSYAGNLLAIFTPQTVKPLSISVNMLSGLGALSHYGTLSKLPQRLPLTPERDAQTAGQAAGLSVLTPTYLPAGVGTPTFLVSGGNTFSFTFSAQKAQAYAQSVGASIPAMPQGIDGTTLYLVMHPAVHEVFGSMATQKMPSLAISQMTAPRVDTQGGVTAQELESYLLQQPGVSPALAAEISALGNPQTTLPIPIPASSAASAAVSVNGVPGVLLSRPDHSASAVVFEQAGVIYAVWGTEPSATLLKVAEGLN